MAALKKAVKFKDGENVLFEEDGLGKLVALVSKGEVKEWRAFDSEGNEVPTVLIRQPGCQESSTGTGKSVRKRRGKTCVKICACYPKGNRCWWECW